MAAMLISLLCAAVTATIPLDGAIEDNGKDYVILEFEVPAGTREIEVAHQSNEDSNVLDWGLRDPDGFRGWGGGLVDSAVVGETEASRGYVPGPIVPGTWQLVIGKALIQTWPATYSVTITLKDEETLTGRERAAFSPVSLAGGQRWYKGDFHVHSNESGDATASLDEIAGLMRQRGMDFVALSDHNTVSHHALASAYQAGMDDVLFLRGVEITTYAGHGNAFGIADYVDHRVGHEGVSATTITADVAGQGGLFSINHPGLDLGDSCIGCAWKHEDTPWDRVQAVEIHTGNYDVSIGLFTPRAIALWDQALDMGYRVTAIGGSDDHRAGIDLSPFQSPIGTPTTLVLASELSEAAILEGVRQGRAIVQLRGPDDPFVELFAKGADGMPVGIGGTTSGSSVTLETRVRGGQGLSLVIVRNGQDVDRVAIDTSDFQHAFQYDVSAQGDRFRAHVVQETLNITITNHVYVDYVPPVAPDCACRGARREPGPGALLIMLTLLGGWLACRRVKSLRLKSLRVKSLG